jgi:hypothetical protein
MTIHSSATAHEETPHEADTNIRTVSEATRGRAESAINDTTIDPQWRTFIRAALELNDPWLAELVSRANAGEDIVDTFESMRIPVANEDDSTLGKVEALAEIISRTGDEPAAALFMLMETIETSRHPEVFTNRAKHVAFHHCGELRVYEMIDAQIAKLEGELLGTNSLAS